MSPREIKSALGDMRRQVPRYRGQVSWEFTYGDDSFNAALHCCLGDITLNHERPEKLVAAVRAIEVLLALQVTARIEVDFDPEPDGLMPSDCADVFRQSDNWCTDNSHRLIELVRGLALKYGLDAEEAK